MVIGSLVTNIVADLSKWGPNLNKARGQMASFVKGIGTLQTAVAAIGVGAAASFVRQQLQWADSLKSTSESLNLTAESFQRLQFAADQLGSNGSSLTAGLRRFNRLLGDAASGGESARAAIQGLGLDVKKLTSIGAQGALFEAIDAIRRAPITEQAARAQEIFGKMGSQLLPFIRAGSDEVRKVMESLYGVGILTDAQVNRMDEYNDKWEHLARIWQGIKGKVGFNIVDEIDSMLPMFGLRSSGRGKTGLPVSFPTTPAIDRSLPANFTSNPALNHNFGQLPGQSPLAVDANQKDFMRGVSQVVSMLPARVQGAIMQGMGAKLPAPVENFFQGIGKFIGQGGLMANPAKSLGMVPGFDLARSGSAESYRQQVRIERQGSGNNKLEQVGNKQLVAQQGMLGELKAIAKSVKDGGVQLVAANFGG